MTTKKQTLIVAEPGKQELFVTREFDAPRELVFRTFSEPQLLERWMLPENKLKVEQMNYKPGGSFRFLMPGPHGKSFAFFGVVHDVLAPERIIKTFEFEALPERGHVALESTLFEILPGNRTKVTIQSVFRSVGDRDGMVNSGMEKTMPLSHALLDELLAKENH